MNKVFAVIVGLLLLVLLVLFSTTYTVRFHEVAVKTTFGKEEMVKDDPGVHFRFPLFIDRVSKYDKRIQRVETPLVEAPTADGQSVVARAFLMWRVAPDNVVRFAQSEDVQFRSGLGGRFLADSRNSEGGINFTYGADLYVKRPLVISTELDLGTLGSAGVAHLRASVGWQLSDFELYAGWDQLWIGGEPLYGPMIGLRYWF